MYILNFATQQEGSITVLQRTVVGLPGDSKSVDELVTGEKETGQCRSYSACSFVPAHYQDPSVSCQASVSGNHM